MIRQIKRKLLLASLPIVIISYPISAKAEGNKVEGNEIGWMTVQSDVVENKSVTEEQICETSVNEVVTNYIIGWTSAKVNVRENPNLDATVLTTFDFNTQVEYVEYDAEWVKIKYQEDVAYMAKDYISNTEYEYLEYNVPAHSDFKSFMGYEAITDKSSNQYQLQVNQATTGQYGIRTINGRFCVAIGSHFETEIGQYFDLVLENGEIIPCIMGDLKADQDTDSQNIFTPNGCCSEFIVDSGRLISSAWQIGSVSGACDEWNSPVKSIRVYKTNVLE